MADAPARAAAGRVALWSFASIAAFALLIVPAMVVVTHGYDRHSSWWAELASADLQSGAVVSTKEHLLLFPAAFGFWAWLSRRLPGLDRSRWALAGFSFLVPALSFGSLVYAGVLDRQLLSGMVPEICAYVATGCIAVAGLGWPYVFSVWARCQHPYRWRFPGVA